MHDTPAVLLEREDVATAGPLVVSAIDRKAGIVAEQQRADRAMADEQHVAAVVSRKHLLGLADDARLRVDRALPAADVDMRLRKELIGNCLEFARLQEAGRRAVVLMHGFTDLDGNTERRTNDFGRLDRLAL